MQPWEQYLFSAVVMAFLLSISSNLRKLVKLLDAHTKGTSEP